MTKKVETPKKEVIEVAKQQETQPIENNDNIIAIKPKSVPSYAYHLKSLDVASIEKMARTLGNPKVKFEGGKMVLYYSSKFPVLFENCVIGFDGQRNITFITSYDKVEANYDILKKQ